MTKQICPIAELGILSLFIILLLNSDKENCNSLPSFYYPLVGITIFNFIYMKYYISLIEFVLYDKRNYYKFFHNADTSRNYGRWVFS